MGSKMEIMKLCSLKAPRTTRRRAVFVFSNLSTNKLELGIKEKTLSSVGDFCSFLDVSFLHSRFKILLM